MCEMGSSLGADSLLIRIPGLQFNDEIPAGLQGCGAFPKESKQALVEMLEMYPFDD